MIGRLVRQGAVGAVLLSTPVILAAQETHSHQDTIRSATSMGHMSGPWKELNAFHMVMMAAWHPAQKNDLAPARARAKELLATAEAWAASTPPAHPAGCNAEPVKAAPAKVVTAVKALISGIDAGGDDARVKGRLKEAHDAFEVAQHGCRGHGGT